VNPTIPHNSLYPTKRRLNVKALFSRHDELRENCFPPLTATSCMHGWKMLRRTNRQNLAGLRTIQSSEMEACKRFELQF